MIQFDTPMVIRGTLVEMHFECIDSLLADPNGCYRLHGIGQRGQEVGTILKHNGKLVEVRTMPVGDDQVKHVKMH